MRNGEVSYWWRALGGVPPRRPSLPGPTEADVCIVGGGYTGLWTAYYLAGLRPGLRIVVLEAAFAGYGASGRNGGWGTAELPGARPRHALAASREWGDGDDVQGFLTRDETRSRVNVAGALGGLYAPASARIQPAALAAGLGAPAERPRGGNYGAPPGPG